MLKWEEVQRIAVRLNGIPVLGCRPGSPAARAGIQYGDILTSVNSVPTPDWAAYIEARALSRGEMRVELFRAGEHLVFELALPAQHEPIDAAGLLEELMENGVAAMIAGGGARPDPEPS
jgi:S1-C subfamily serine protease